MITSMASAFQLIREKKIIILRIQLELFTHLEVRTCWHALKTKDNIAQGFRPDAFLFLHNGSRDGI